MEVDAAGGAVALGDGPHDQRLATLHVACGKDARRIGHPAPVLLVRSSAI